MTKSEEERPSCMALSPSSSRLSEAFPDLEIRLMEFQVTPSASVGMFAVRFAIRSAGVTPPRRKSQRPWSSWTLVYHVDAHLILKGTSSGPNISQGS